MCITNIRQIAQNDAANTTDYCVSASEWLKPAMLKNTDEKNISVCVSLFAV